MTQETLLYGLAAGDTKRYQEQLLLSNATPEKIERVKELAAADGFHSFRTTTVDLNKSPDFTKALKG